MKNYFKILLINDNFYGLILEGKLKKFLFSLTKILFLFIFENKKLKVRFINKKLLIIKRKLKIYLNK